MSQATSPTQTRDLVSQMSGIFQYYHQCNGIYTYVSASITAVLGYSKEAFLCHYSTYLVDSDINDEIEKNKTLCSNNNAQQAYEICIYHKNRTIKWLLLHETPDINTQGQVIGIHGIAVDITLQKQRQHELADDVLNMQTSLKNTKNINQQSMQQMAKVRKLWSDTQRSYEKEKKRYLSIIRNSFDAILILNESGQIKEINPATIALFGWEREEFLQKEIHHLIPSFHCSIECGDCFSHLHQTIGLHKDKHKIHLEVIPSLITLKHETLLSITIHDTSARKKSEVLLQEHELKLESRVTQRTAQLKHANDELLILAKKMETLNCLDELTGIYNRRGFNQAYDKEWKMACRAKKSTAIIMIDIDHFKQFNDSYGHQQGDVCLKKVAATLANSIHRPSDYVCRYGGEEFIAILPETSESGAAYLAELFRKKIENLHIQHQASSISTYVTISLGVAVCVPQQSIQSDDLVKKADQALYKAKASRNSFVALSMGQFA